MLKHVLLYRQRHFFGKWKHNTEKVKLAEMVNVRFRSLTCFKDRRRCSFGKKRDEEKREGA